MGQKRILIIDYGMGNIGSITSALDYLGGSYFVSQNRKDLDRADAFILPGVGAFGAAMQNLRRLDIVDELTDHVLNRRKPYLGICLGMQLLAKDSVEQGFFTGLGWIDGHVLALEPQRDLRVPHVGWNNVEFKQCCPLFRRIDEGASFFFDHSYHLRCDDALAVATFEYGALYVAAIQKGNIFATQFHPEKSQRNGLKMLRNYLNQVYLQ